LSIARAGGGSIGVSGGAPAALALRFQALALSTPTINADHQRQK